MIHSYRVDPSGRERLSGLRATVIHGKLPTAGGPAPLAAAVALSIAALAASKTGSAASPAAAWNADAQGVPSRLVESGSCARTRTPKADGSLTSSTTRA